MEIPILLPSTLQDGPAPGAGPGQTAPGSPGSMEPGGQEAQPEGWNPMFLLLIIGVIFWFLVLGPERKNRRKREAMLSAIQKGDKVMTTGGLFGTIVQIKEDVVTLQVDEGVRLKFARSAIQGLSDPEEAAKRQAAQDPKKSKVDGEKKEEEVSS